MDEAARAGPDRAARPVRDPQAPAEVLPGQAPLGPASERSGTTKHQRPEALPAPRAAEAAAPPSPCPP